MAQRPTATAAVGRFALFADCLLVGVASAVTALGVVTAYPAFVAACAAVRERVADGRTGAIGAYLAALRQVTRAGWTAFVVPVAVLAVLALDLLAVAAGVPGSPVLLAVLVVIGAAATVLGLRAAAGWRPGRTWRAVGIDAADRSRGDVGGSLLLLFAAASAAGIVAAVPVTALLLLGPLAVAAVAVDARSR
ncbi:hypothetical protein E1269_31565 [Jiangella asiatica]|uniref:DUF624 domain-containing protein n=1 Tax=Jiangella asiatica TaxID=2530372 RepID=A0A4R5C9T3_9ACTN|nr:hypothetical protein E1269_31565 [Jiangella asiatica]